MGRWLRAAGYLPNLVVCSTARRARETWQLAQARLAGHFAGQLRRPGYQRLVGDAACWT